MPEIDIAVVEMKNVFDKHISRHCQGENELIWISAERNYTERNSGWGGSVRKESRAFKTCEWY